MFFLAIFIGVVFSTYVSTNKKTAENLIETSLYRQQQLTTLNAYNVKSFLNLSSKSMILLSQNLHQVSSNADRQELLDNLMQQLSLSPISGILITDANGVVKFKALETGISDLGTDVSDREYFTWAKQAKDGDVWISKPLISKLGASKGKSIAVVTTPIIIKDQFQGALVEAIVLEDFFRYYLGESIPLYFDTYLIDSDGTIYVAPDSSLVGENIFQLAKAVDGGLDLFKTEFNKIKNSSVPGRTQAVLKVSGNDNPSRSLMSFAPISNMVGSNKWMLITISTPRAALALTSPIYLQQISLIIGIFFFLLFSSILALKFIEVK